MLVTFTWWTVGENHHVQTAAISCYILSMYYVLRRSSMLWWFYPADRTRSPWLHYLRLLGDINKAVKLWVWQIINYVGLSENATKFHGLSSFSSLPHKKCHEIMGYVPVLDKPILQNPNLVLLNFEGYRPRTGNTPWMPTHEWRLCWSFFRQRVYLDGPWDYLTN